MQTALGEMMQYYLKQEPHLFRANVEEQLQRLRDERDAEAERRSKHTEQQIKADSSDLVLYR